MWEANYSTVCIQIEHSPEPEGGNLVGKFVSKYIPTQNNGSFH